MAEKILNTRIALKYDTYASWGANNPILKKGEVAFATIETNADGVHNAPSVLIKVGDGKTAYNSLKFVSGLAADVYGWAKEATKPTYKAEEIEGLDTFVSNEQTDTQYRILKVDDYNYKLQSKAKGAQDTAFADVSTITIPKYDDTEVKTDIAALEKLVGNTSVATQIANAITALDLANTYEAKGTAATEAGKVQTALDNYKTEAEAKRTSLEARVTTLIGDDANKSVRTIANEELAAQLIPDGAKESLDTLAEIAAWIQDHPDDASAMNAAIAALQKQLNGIAAGDGTVKKYVDDAVAALKIGDYAKAADLTTLAGRVTALETDVEDLATIAKTGNVNDLVQADGDVLVLDCGNSAV